MKTSKNKILFKYVVLGGYNLVDGILTYYIYKEGSNEQQDEARKLGSIEKK